VAVKSKTQERLERLTGICLALPGAIREEMGQHARFLVAKKVFAYYLNDHHGDKIVSVCARVVPGDSERLIALSPHKFYMPAYIGPRGWVGLRLDLPTVDWAEIRELVRGSYALVVPKKLLRMP
jgi:predicted DNA-binding protein (MmcQ/YjbR family)